MKRFWAFSLAILFIFELLFISGCTVKFYRGRPGDNEKIGNLTSEVERLNDLRSKEKKELEDAKALLEERLKKEIDEDQIKLELAERGLVITFVSEILFDSGKAQIRPEAYEALNKVAKVVKEKVSDRDIGVEGYTDNVPIKRSGWKSNWELSTARATSVLHYLIEDGKLNPSHLAAIGYGEYRPVTTNDTPEGRQKNRRVEIVILPKEIPKVQFEEDMKRAEREIKAMESKKAEEEEQIK